MIETDTIASKVRKYLSDNPEIWKSLDLGVVNLSALSKTIMNDLGTDKFDAIMGALKRIPRSGISSKVYREVLKNSRIETRTDVSVIVLKPTTENLRLLIGLTRNIAESYSDFRIIQATQGCGLVIGDDLMKRIMKFVPENEIIEKTQGLGEIIIVSPPSILDLRGYVSFASSLLSNRGINVLQVVSFFTDITFILKPEYLLNALDVLMSVKES